MLILSGILVLSTTGFSQNLATDNTIDIGNGITIHYVEKGSGPPLILVHGSLSDYTYWLSQMTPLSRHYRVVAYSRRYNWPNSNPERNGYSAEADAEDLVSLIGTMHLGKVYLVGHSYGALTSLFVAARHPELLKAIVLAEPPLVPLLKNLSGRDSETGKELYADLQTRMVAPMVSAFSRGNTEAGVSTFINFVFNDPQAWHNLSPASRAETLKDAHEWEVVLTRGTLFPELAIADLRAIQTPVLLMSGAKSYWFLGPIDSELLELLPNSRQIIFSNTGHQMWLQHPDEARGYAEAFFDLYP